MSGGWCVYSGLPTKNCPSKGRVMLCKRTNCSTGELMNDQPMIGGKKDAEFWNCFDGETEDVR